MNTKLTLTIQKDVITTAKAYAQEQGQSLSDLVENYFKLLTSDRRELPANQLSPRVQRLRGILPSAAQTDYKKILEEELTEKYGR